MVCYNTLFLRIFNATMKAAILWIEEVRAIRNEYADGIGDQTPAPGFDTPPPSPPSVSYPGLSDTDPIQDLLDQAVRSPPSASFLKRAHVPDTPPRSYGQNTKRVRVVTPNTPDPANEYNLPLMAAFLDITGLNGNTEGTWSKMLDMAKDFTDMSKASTIRSKFRNNLKNKTPAEMKTLAMEFKMDHAHVYECMYEQWSLSKKKSGKAPKAASKKPVDSDDGSESMDPKQFAQLIKIFKEQNKKKKKRYDSSDYESD